jgi:glycosyltransferase involved in cell wall biosynthesis
MKILQVNIDGWFYGRPKYVYTLSKLLIKNNVDCKIVGGSGLFEEELEKGNIRNIRIFARWKSIDRSVLSIVNLYRVVKNEKPDLIHSHGISENIIAGVIGFMLKIPVIVTYHTNPFNKYRNENTMSKKLKRYLYELLYFRFLTKLASPLFSYITVISKDLQRSFIHNGHKKEKVVVIYFGIDIPPNNSKFIAKKGKELIIVFVGRVSKDKGCDCLLKACKIIASRGNRFTLYFIGDGNIRFFSEMATELGIRENVVFMGFQREFGDTLMQGDVFVLPSRDEGLGISILEAMSYGLPVIATNVGGIPEVIEDGKNGFLVPPSDEVSLANAIRRMIEMGNNGRHIMGLKNKKKIESKFSSRKMVNSHLDIYKKAVSH